MAYLPSLARGWRRCLRARAVALDTARVPPLLFRNQEDYTVAIL